MHASDNAVSIKVKRVSRIGAPFSGYRTTEPAASNLLLKHIGKRGKMKGKTLQEVRLL